MGQAAVDLPDPLEQPSSAGAVTNADDLLAQLAGDEIDRLLAEAEVEQESAAPFDQAEPAEAPVEPAAVSIAPPAAIPPTVEPASVSDPAPAKPLDKAAAKAAVFQEQLQGQLDDLFSELTKDPQDITAPAQPTDAAPPVSVVAPPVVDSPLETPIDIGSTPAEPPTETAHELDQSLSAAAPAVLPPAEAEARIEVPRPGSDKGPDFSDQQTSAAERDALDETPAITTLDAITQQLDAAATDVDLPDDEAPLPIYLRPLEWLNAPFESLSPGLRETLGKVALITLVNAVAVLLYVMIFR